MRTLRETHVLRVKMFLSIIFYFGMEFRVCLRKLSAYSFLYVEHALRAIHVKSCLFSY